MKWADAFHSRRSPGIAVGDGRPRSSVSAKRGQHVVGGIKYIDGLFGNQYLALAINGKSVRY